MVWKEGRPGGVTAATVPGLFPTPTPSAPDETLLTPEASPPAVVPVPEPLPPKAGWFARGLLIALNLWLARSAVSFKAMYDSLRSVPTTLSCPLAAPSPRSLLLVRPMAGGTSPRRPS